MKRKLPIWLHNLRQVKEELASEHWPHKRRLETGIKLLALGINLMKARRKRIKDFSELDQRWVRRWRKERERAFSNSGS